MKTSPREGTYQGLEEEAAQPTKVTDANAAVLAALTHLGRQIQTNPDVAYYLGVGTESFRLIAAALAALTGKPVAHFEAALEEDHQPSYRRRRAEVLDLREQVAQLRESLGQ